jgi:hypothetical protein
VEGEAMLKRVSRRLRALVRGDDLELELDEELRYHLDRQIEQNLPSGMGPEEAHYAALRGFDGPERARAPHSTAPLRVAARKPFEEGDSPQSISEFELR